MLADLRKASAAKHARLTHPWPAGMDPFAAFAGYPTRALSAQTRLALVDGNADTAFIASTNTACSRWSNMHRD
jgi:hypothetical protein